MTQRDAIRQQIDLIDDSIKQMNEDHETSSEFVRSIKMSLPRPYRRHKRPADELRVALNEVENTLFETITHLMQVLEAFRRYWEAFEAEHHY